MTAKTVTLGPWANRGDFSRAALTIGTLPVYRVKVNAKSHRPGNPVAIESYIPGHKYPWTGNRNVSIALAAQMLAEMGAGLDDLENFFQKVAEMGWGDDLVLEARRAANQFITAPESSAYLVIRLLSGVVGEYEYLPTMAEAQQAVADHCGVETTDLQSSAGIPWGAVFSATNGDKYDAWAFPVHDSGEYLADLSARVETISQHRWQLWEAFHTAAARLRVHGLEVPDAQLPPGTGCPYCGSQRLEKHLSTEFPFQVCCECRFVSPVVCPECRSTDITYTWTPDRSPTGFVRRQTLAWQCHTCGHEWNQDEAVDEEDSREVPA